MVGRGSEVARVCRPAEVPKPRVDLMAAGRVERLRDPVPDPLERSHVAGHAGHASGGGIELELARPENESLAVDLDRGPVQELEVERGLGAVERRLAAEGGA